MAVATARAEPPAADADGFRPIFDGKTLAGWDGDPQIWSVEDGCLTGQTTKEHPAPYNTFLIWRGAKPGDFQLKIEFRMPNPGFANSGVQIRSWEGQPKQKWRVFGYQPDMDADDHYTGTCYGENFAADWPAAARRSRSARTARRRSNASATRPNWPSSSSTATGTSTTSPPRETASSRRSTGT